MGRIIFSISYHINPEKRDEYLELMKQVRNEIKEFSGQEYTVYEDARTPHLMSEVFYLENEKELEKVKEFQKEKSIESLDKIEQFILNRDKVAIRTFKEVL